MPKLRHILSYMRLVLSAAFVIASCSASRAQTLTGVNLSGAEFSPSHLPGRYGWDYSYPNDDEIEYFTHKGVNIFRIPVRWERLQPSLNGPLDPKELARLSQVIADAHAHGASVIIDIHNYANYQNIGLEANPAVAASFADLWKKLAVQFGQDDYVIFGLMNEPKIRNKDFWTNAVQEAIDGIRRTGARNLILVSGTGWDGAHNFVAINSASLALLKDPDNHMDFEVHQYFDKNASGTSDVCVPPDQAVATLKSFTQWLRTTKRQGFLGEFGASRNPNCLAALDQVLSYLQANSEVWLGWTYWAAGPRWGNYMFTVEPDKGQDRPQMASLQKYLHPSQSNTQAQ